MTGKVVRFRFTTLEEQVFPTEQNRDESNGKVVPGGRAIHWER